MGIAFVMMAFTATTPVMAKLVEQFGAEYGQYISFLSSGYVFTMVPVTIISGILVGGGKVGYRPMTIIGSALLVLGGVMPALVHGSFGIIIVAKLIFGVGLGMLMPLANALVIGLYEGQQQAKYLGWITLFMNAGGIVFQLVGGFIADAGGMAGWYLHFWAYGIAIVCFLLSFFIPEPAKPAPAEGAHEKVKAKIPGIVWVIALLLCLVNILNYPVMMYMSNLFAARGIGGDNVASVTAMALTMFTVAGVIAGFLYGYMFKALGRFVLPVAYFLMALGAFLIWLASNIGVAVVGTSCLGFGFSMLMPSLMQIVGMRTPPERSAVAVSLVMAIMNLGALAATYYLVALTGIIGDGVTLYQSLPFIEVFIFAALGALFIFVNLFPKAPAAPRE